MSAARSSCLAFVFAFLIAPFSFVIGWRVAGFEVGLLAAAITFVSFLIVGGIALALVKDMSWVTVATPLLGAVVYLVLPDFLPLLPFDDAAVLLAGSLGSFSLAVKKEPTLPRWLFVPLLASAIYTLFGPLIPGPIDELLVLLISTGGTGWAAHHHRKTLPRHPDVLETPHLIEPSSVDTTRLVDTTTPEQVSNQERHVG